MRIRADADLLTLAHHGLVYADCESGAITRIQREAEPATVTRNGHQLSLGNRLDLRYQPTMIGTKEFLLAQSAEEINRLR